MKSFKLLPLLFLFAALVSTAQQQIPPSGAYYCSMKKSNGHNLSDKPYNIAAVPPHTFDVIKYTMDVDLYACYSPPYPKNFNGSVILKFRVH